MTDFTDLKRRVEEAQADETWELIRLVGEHLGVRDSEDLWWSRTISPLLVVDAYLDATVALIERVMPGMLWGISPQVETDPLLRGSILRRHDSAGGPSFWTLSYGYHRVPVLALLSALLSACEQGGKR